MVTVYLPARWMAVSGVGTSRVSDINAFDKALDDCGLGDYNIVPVSSIIPASAVEVDNLDVEPGSVLYAVVAKAEGTGGQRLSAGIAWAKPDGHIGVVMESHDVNSQKASPRRTLERRVREAMALRELPESKVRVVQSTLRVPKDHFGCALCCFVLSD